MAVCWLYISSTLRSKTYSVRNAWISILKGDSTIIIMHQACMAGMSIQIVVCIRPKLGPVSVCTSYLSLWKFEWVFWQSQVEKH